jgi:hypothetical protein
METSKLVHTTSFKYFKLQLKLITEQLGTCTEASIYAKHVQEKAKKEILAANRLAGKLSKSLEKYKGVEFPDTKAVQELQAILRAYMGRTGVKHELPDNAEELVTVAAEIKAEWEDMMAEGGSAPTVFFRDKDGHAVISTHMILGNLKENLKIITNNGDKELAKSKVAVAEMGTLDIKVVEDFVRPSNDVVMDGEGKPALLERPIRFERMGKTETAISRSEMLPAGTEFEMTLRVRASSPLCDQVVLSKLLDLGKNNGLGQWRGSGKKGTFAFKLEPIADYKDPRIPTGWN